MFLALKTLDNIQSNGLKAFKESMLFSVGGTMVIISIVFIIWLNQIHIDKNEQEIFFLF